MSGERDLLTLAYLEENSDAYDKFLTLHLSDPDSPRTIWDTTKISENDWEFQ